jgi:glutamine synthetase
MDFLEENGFCDTLNEGTGIAEIPVSVLEKALQKAKELEIEETYIEQELKYDIEWAKKRGEDYIRYYCF